MTSDIFHRVQRIDYFIQRKGTGPASNLARKLGICEKSVYLYINLMRDFGAPIKFCSIRKTFYYEIDGSFNIAFMPSINEEVHTPEL